MSVLRPEAAGGRDRLITLQSLIQTTGGSGFPIEKWVNLATVWAMKFDPPIFFNRERFWANQEIASYQTIWTIPYMPSMDPELVEVAGKRRILVKNRVHDILAVIEINRRMGISLFTQAGGLMEVGPPGQQQQEVG